MENSDPLLKKIVKGAGFSLFGMAAVTLFGYLYRLLVARILGPEDYGLISIALAVASMLIMLSMLGTSNGIIRFTSYHSSKGDERRTRGVLISALKMTVPVGVLSFLLLFFLSDAVAESVFHNSRLGDVLRIISVTIPVIIVSNAFANFSKGLKKIEYPVLVTEAGRSALKLLLTAAVLFSGFSIAGVAWAYTISIIATTALIVYLVWKKTFSLSGKTLEMKREMMRYSFPLIFGGIMGYIVSWTDTLMLGWMKDATLTGIYNTALPTAQILGMLPSIFLALFFPIITGLYAKDRMDEIRSIYKTVVKWIFASSMPLALFFILFSGEMMSVLFGEEYAAGAVPLSILSLGFLVTYLTTAAGDILSMIKKTKIIMMNSIAAGTVNIILNVLLIPEYGIVGAAIASAASLVAVSLLSIIEAWHYTGLHPLKRSYLGIVIAGIASSGIVYAVSGLFGEISFFVLGGLFAFYMAVYLFILILLKTFERDDIMILKSVKQKVFPMRKE